MVHFVEQKDDRNAKVDVSLKIHQMYVEGYQECQAQVDAKKLVEIIPVIEERFSE